MVADIEISTWMSAGLWELCHGSRLWNEYSRSALAAELIKHHALRIPKHFELGARSTYNYQRRRLVTERKKIFYWHVPGALDLVRSGKMKASIKRSYSLSFRGQFGSPGGPTSLGGMPHAWSGTGTLEGRLHMQLPYNRLLDGKTGGITSEEIISEIVRTTDAEARAIGEGYVYSLAQRINAFAGPLKFLRRTRSGGTDAYRAVQARSPYGKLMPVGAGSPPSISKRYGPGF